MLEKSKRLLDFVSVKIKILSSSCFCYYQTIFNSILIIFAKHWLEGSNNKMGGVNGLSLRIKITFFYLK